MEIPNKPVLKIIVLTLFYLAIMVSLTAMYGKGNFETPKFIYQEF
ncbi:MAG TPA: teichoic acid D-Ala incorporation-associated protein DltX [Patescibacteria group bacterium]